MLHDELLAVNLGRAQKLIPKNWRFHELANPRNRERDSMKWASMESRWTSLRIREKMVPEEI
jgi:hypothetical protein